MVGTRPMVKKWTGRSHVAECPGAVALSSKAARVWCDGCNTKAPKSGAIVFMSVCLSLQVLPRDLHDMQPEQSPSGAVDRLLRRTLAWLTLASGLKIYAADTLSVLDTDVVGACTSHFRNDRGHYPGQGVKGFRVAAVICLTSTVSGYRAS